MNAQLEELACLYVLDGLDPRERAAFEARLSREPALRLLVREVEAACARRISALPQVEPPRSLLAGIEARIDRIERAARAPAPVAPTWTSVARWGIAAVIAVGVGIIAVQSLRRPAAMAARPYFIVVGLDSLGGTLAELPLRDAAPNADASFIQLASLAEKYWDRPQDLPVALGSGSRSGFALFDPGSNQGFIAIRVLPAVERGKEYRLWLLDTVTGRVRQAGVLPAPSQTSGLYFFSVASEGGRTSGRPDFFVTSEDASDPAPAQPHGKVVLGDGKI